MTGTNKYLIMSRQSNEMEHDYLSGTGIVKSKTSIGLTIANSGSNHPTHKSTNSRFNKDSNNNNNNNSYSYHHPNYHQHFYSKRRERSNVNILPNTKTSHQLATAKSGGTNTSTSQTADVSGSGPIQQTGPKKSRHRQKSTDPNSKTTASKSRAKESTAINNHDVTSPVSPSSMLPPIMNLQITNNNSPQPMKNGERSPRNVESATAHHNSTGTYSMAPTRMALRQSTSPDEINIQPNFVNTSNPQPITNNMNSTVPNPSKHKVTANEVPSHHVPPTLKHASSSQSHGAGGRRSSLTLRDSNHQYQISRSLTSNAIHQQPASSSSPQPSSPKLQCEYSRCSPVHTNDKPKTKFEKRVIKSMQDNGNNNTNSKEFSHQNSNNTLINPNSPRTHRLASVQTDNATEPTTNKDGKHLNTQHRKSSVRSLPKITQPEDQQFSIRKKIEQFKKWHEEQLADNLKRLPNEDGSDGTGSGKSKNRNEILKAKAERLPPTNSNADMTDYAKILEDKIIENNHVIHEIVTQDLTRNENTDLLSRNMNRVIQNEGKENTDDNGNICINDNENDNDIEIQGNKINSKVYREGNNRGKKSARFGGKRMMMNAKNRPISGATWKTWRDVNQSDAYNDVNKYILDNELMDDERAEWIRTWIQDVHTAMAENLIDTAVG